MWVCFWSLCSFALVCLSQSHTPFMIGDLPKVLTSNRMNSSIFFIFRMILALGPSSPFSLATYHHSPHSTPLQFCEATWTFSSQGVCTQALPLLATFLCLFCVMSPTQLSGLSWDYQFLWEDCVWSLFCAPTSSLLAFITVIWLACSLNCLRNLLDPVQNKKCEALCSKMVKNFRTVTAEH